MLRACNGLSEVYLHLDDEYHETIMSCLVRLVHRLTRVEDATYSIPTISLLDHMLDCTLIFLEVAPGETGFLELMQLW